MKRYGEINLNNSNQVKGEAIKTALTVAPPTQFFDSGNNFMTTILKGIEAPVSVVGKCDGEWIAFFDHSQFSYSVFQTIVSDSINNQGYGIKIDYGTEDERLKTRSIHVNGEELKESINSDIQPTNDLKHVHEIVANYLEGGEKPVRKTALGLFNALSYLGSEWYFCFSQSESNSDSVLVVFRDGNISSGAAGNWKIQPLDEEDSEASLFQIVTGAVDLTKYAIGIIHPDYPAIVEPTGQTVPSSPPLQFE